MWILPSEDPTATSAPYSASMGAKLSAVSRDRVRCTQVTFAQRGRAWSGNRGITLSRGTSAKDSMRASFTRSAGAGRA